MVLQQNASNIVSTIKNWLSVMCRRNSGSSLGLDGSFALEWFITQKVHKAKDILKTEE